ncbi:N-6 DNA methylase [Cellulomonas sp. ACRRI]|uniref:Eco57I restriction-modification methylase domain-containing protein n=1 Tax=Cellulomonas sp. ACRRI TaxID=2918188 RepID=UPI001EF333F5|nr:N-6 DNA methylase [Cellulomonas sp. ACRRI]MCG7285446.1 N-6 DNA methylase [Cellulomonas sp. ACRRI]
MAGDLTAVRSIGALLPSDLLARVAAGDGELGGFSGWDYHLAAGETPREAANRAWAYLIGVWPSFHDALSRLPEGDPAVGVTRERWLQVLFRELGYGRLQATPAGGITASGKSFPVSHQWGAVPIHLLGWGVDLDRRTKSVPGAAERAPHAMVQELLNRSDEHLWAVVSNGRVVRVLRDSTSLSAQSFVEFDLEAMFSGELFADFVVLFLLLHQSRLEVLTDDAGPSECWLERWRTTAIATGARALSLLSDGVQAAIADLGTGFLRATPSLRQRLDEDSLHLADYHQALLRLVYRMLFLFVAEDRQALHPLDSDPTAQARYRDYFSTDRLRRLALRRRGTRHGDLWQVQRLVIARLGQDDGCPELALPGLGGLFDDDGAELFTDADLPNDALLSAIRHLSTVRPKGQPLRTVDYKNLGAEELGSIYESLLELVPRYHRTEQTFTLENLAGNDRKTTGSYYTPSSLIDLVLDETLTPLLDEAERAADPQAALLAMSVCDPACGSGHFLVAAARRIAERLAIVRSGETDPTPTDLQDALYDVVGSCIYGVDLNPLAAELAKVSLWLESMQAGRPLTFLDAHLKVGNALLGTTPALLAGGIPDDAFTALTGDDKRFTTALRKRNKAERETTAGADSLFDLVDVGTSTIDLRGRLSKAVAPATGAPRLREVHAAQRAYTQYQSSPELTRERLHADAWCAAFVQVKAPGTTAITTGVLESLHDGTAPETLVRVVQRLAAESQFFHWHLEFPDVFHTNTPNGAHGWSGGFTAVIGNPPWERVTLQEQEFFSQRDSRIATAKTAALRKKLILELRESNSSLADSWASASRRSAQLSLFLHKSGRYPLCGVGDVNTYAVFAELFQSLVKQGGRLGIITQTELATGSTAAAFLGNAVRRRELVAFYDFENEAKIFPSVTNKQHFAVSVLSVGRPAGSVHFASYVRHVGDAKNKRILLTPDQLAKVSPNSGTLPIFRGARDADLTVKLHEQFPVLVHRDAHQNRWGVRFARLLDMATDSALFLDEHELTNREARFNGWGWDLGKLDWMPLYEAKMLWHFDHRFATYRGATQAQLNKGTLPRAADSAHADPTYEPRARYWVKSKDAEAAIPSEWREEWFLGWRDITGGVNERTLIPAIIPRSAVGHVFPVMILSRPSDGPVLQALLSSFICDYLVRQKISGTHATYEILYQVAVPGPSDFQRPLQGVTECTLGEWVLARVLELNYTSERMAGFAKSLSGSTQSSRGPFKWVPSRRERMRVELDAAMFVLYGLDRDEVEHVMDSFFVVRKYEQRDHGEFRTKRLILEAYDAMTDAAASGAFYVSPLDPPAGHGPRHDH